MQDIVDVTGAQFNSDHALYQVPCDTQFQWTVTFGGHDFVVDQTQALIDVKDNMCLLAFDVLETSDYDYLLG
jgi:hypothetical protein